MQFCYTRCYCSEKRQIIKKGTCNSERSMRARRLIPLRSYESFSRLTKPIRGRDDGSILATERSMSLRSTLVSYQQPGMAAQYCDILFQDCLTFDLTGLTSKTRWQRPDPGHVEPYASVDSTKLLSLLMTLLALLCACH